MSRGLPQYPSDEEERARRKQNDYRRDDLARAQDNAADDDTRDRLAAFRKSHHGSSCMGPCHAAAARLATDEHRVTGTYDSADEFLAALPTATDEGLRAALLDAHAALHSLVGDHDVHPAHLPECAICVALNGRTSDDGRLIRAALAAQEERP